MPKMKSKRSAAKRFSFTGTGKVKRGGRLSPPHDDRQADGRQGRAAPGALPGAKGDAALVKLMLPYG